MHAQIFFRVNVEDSGIHMHMNSGGIKSAEEKDGIVGIVSSNGGWKQGSV